MYFKSIKSLGYTTIDPLDKNVYRPNIVLMKIFICEISCR